jgi:hypothetical protein
MRSEGYNNKNGCGEENKELNIKLCLREIYRRNAKSGLGPCQLMCISKLQHAPGYAHRKGQKTCLNITNTCHT